MPARGTTSTPRASWAAAGSSVYPGRPFCTAARRWPPRREWCATPGPRPPRWCRTGRKSSPPLTVHPRAGPGLDDRPRAGHRRGRCQRADVRPQHRPAGDRRRRRADHPGRAPPPRPENAPPQPSSLPTRGIRAAGGRRRSPPRRSVRTGWRRPRLADKLAPPSCSKAT